jgi:peptidoglycan hydrolase CwlO-like protein
MNFWTKVRDDLQKGVGEGIAMVKEGASVVKKKAEELTEEGKRRYQLYELKTKVHKEISELGGTVYDLSEKVKNPMLNDKVKVIKARIKKLEVQIQKLEGKPEAKPGKAAPKKKPVRKVKESPAKTKK